MEKTASHSKPDNYDIYESNDAKMTASCQVNHAAHVTVTDIFLQRTNKVALVSKRAGCEMQVVSNFSGWEHDDKSDFKKRAGDALLKRKGGSPNQ